MSHIILSETILSARNTLVILELQSESVLVAVAMKTSSPNLR